MTSLAGKEIGLPAVRSDSKVKRAAKHFHFPAGFTTTRTRGLQRSLVSPVKSKAELIRFVPQSGI